MLKRRRFLRAIPLITRKYRQCSCPIISHSPFKIVGLNCLNYCITTAEPCLNFSKLHIPGPIYTGKCAMRICYILSTIIMSLLCVVHQQFIGPKYTLIEHNRRARSKNPLQSIILGQESNKLPGKNGHQFLCRFVYTIFTNNAVRPMVGTIFAYEKLA